MQIMLEHIKTICELEKIKFKLDHIKYNPYKLLLDRCNSINDKKIPEEMYKDSITIQSELIRDKEFVNYLMYFNNQEISINEIEYLITKLRDNKDKISNYTKNQIIETINNKSLDYKSYYDYLKYYSNKNLSIEEKNIVGNNLKEFNKHTIIKISDFNDSERELFKNAFISNNKLMSILDKEVYEFLSQNLDLRNIILFLYNNDLIVDLNLREYENLNKNSKTIYNYITEIFKKISDKRIMTNLLKRWVENNCNIYDLKVLLNEIDSIDFEKVLLNRATYINCIFGNKIKNLKLDNLTDEQQDILIYAISNNKKSFIKLIENNQEDFINLSYSSILLLNRFYENYFNINTLNIKELRKFNTIKQMHTNILYLNPQFYSFKEIEVLAYEAPIYCRLYNRFLDLPIDNRILIIRQLIKKHLLPKRLENIELDKLAKYLKIKNLYKWLENDFKHIKNIKPSDVISILINYNDIKRFIPQIMTRNELLYVIRNKEKIKEYNSLESIKKDIDKIDMYWEKLVNIMNLSNDFILENNKLIINFLLNNGAELALKYYESCEERQREKFKLIIKAQLMGKFKTLKYHNKDLENEIEFPIKEYQIKEWINNNHISDNELEVKEYDDFYSTMIIGEEPEHTCLSYINGAYNRCLLACFDSNKKILYAKQNGKIVARAMVRLTKGKHVEGSYKKRLSFTDVEKIETSNKINNNINDELLILFLEKIYISSVSPKVEERIIEMFIKLLQKKATIMNAQLVLSYHYSNIKRNDYVITKFYIFISKSKAGTQYLDSLNGQASICDEGSYRSNNFLIWKPKYISQ